MWASNELRFNCRHQPEDLQTKHFRLRVNTRALRSSSTSVAWRHLFIDGTSFPRYLPPPPVQNWDTPVKLVLRGKLRHRSFWCCSCSEKNYGGLLFRFHQKIVMIGGCLTCCVGIKWVSVLIERHTRNIMRPWRVAPNYLANSTSRSTETPPHSVPSLHPCQAQRKY